MKKLFYSLLISISFLSFLFLTNTYAQSLSIGTAPTHEKLRLEPGQLYNDNFTVWNLSTTTTTYYIKVSSFRQIENQPGSAIFLSEEEDAKNPYSAADWVEVEMDSIDLVPNRNFTIDYTITVPEELAPGDYNAEIYFTSQEAVGGGETAAYSILGSASIHTKLSATTVPAPASRALSPVNVMLKGGSVSAVVPVSSAISISKLHNACPVVAVAGGPSSV